MVYKYQPSKELYNSYINIWVLNDKLALDYLKHFDLWSSKKQVSTYRLLIFNGYGSHRTYEFIKYCDDRKIIPFSLPPYTSHLLQPLDIGVFQPLKHYYKSAVEQATRTGCINFNKVKFLNAIHSIRVQTFKRSTIIHSFKNSGLIPFNPLIVLQKIKLPNRPSTPETEDLFPIQLWACTPKTPQTTKQYVNYFKKKIEKRQPIPWRALQKIYNAALHNTISLSLAMEELQAIQASVQKRNKRQQPNQRVVQKGGLINVGDARLTIAKRIDKDQRKGTKGVTKKGTVTASNELTIVQYSPSQNNTQAG